MTKEAIEKVGSSKVALEASKSWFDISVATIVGEDLRHLIDRTLQLELRCATLKLAALPTTYPSEAAPYWQERVDLLSKATTDHTYALAFFSGVLAETSQHLGKHTYRVGDKAKAIKGIASREAINYLTRLTSD